MPERDPLTWAAVLECSERGRPWLDPAERWRGYLTVDDEARVFCQRCASRELEDDDA